MRHIYRVIIDMLTHFEGIRKNSNRKDTPTFKVQTPYITKKIL